MLIIVGTRKSELGPGPQGICHEPFEDEVVRKAEAACPGPAVQARVPQRIRDWEIFKPLFRIIKIPADLSVRSIFSVVWICIRIFCKGNSRVGCLHIIYGQLVAELEFSCTVYQIHISLNCLTFGSFHYSVNISVAEAYSVSDLILSAFCIDVMLVGESRTDRLAEPIGIHSPLYLLESLVPEVVKTDLVERIARVVLIYACKGLELKLLAGIHEVIVRQIRQRKAEIAFIRKLQTSSCRSLRLNDHDSVRCLGTIYCSRRRILEDGHRSHTVHVQVHYRLESRLEAVENEQRLVRIGPVFLLEAHDAGLSSDLYVRHHVRIGSELGALHHLEGRIEGLEALKHVVVTN